MRTGTIALAGLVCLLVASCGDNLGAGKDAGGDAPGVLCGNGVIDGAESCDDGDANGGPGARCTTMCTWACTDASDCSDQEPCNGEETCTDHVCAHGVDQADGTSCGTGKLCRNTACTDAVCGDGFVTAPGEECDDGNSTTGDGCENDCTFSCVSTDTLRDCTPSDACAGQGTCNDATHVCSAGTPLGDNTSCGTGGYCLSGTCTQPDCGNGVTEPGETCDLGASNGTAGSGCKGDCTYECVTAATDCPNAPACKMKSCNTAHACEAIADASLNGTSCGSGLVCAAGACVAISAVCGNGTIEAGEQCDYGAGLNTSGSGCESNCQFSCAKVPTDSCDDSNACNGTETCTTTTVNTRSGQKCQSTAALAPGSSCGTNQLCLNNLCVNPTCGDGFVTGPGETCEPPSAGTCDASCHTVACGDHVRAGSEQCDDGNLTNLDGCDASCKFEQSHRVNALAMSFTTDTFCMTNALGGAIVGGLAQPQINSALTTGVNNGSITIELKAINLDDLTGTNDDSLSLGALTGSPVTGTTTYNGALDVDWWYTTAATVIDQSRIPKTQVPAAIASKSLTGGPADITITVSLAGVPATLDMLGARLVGNVGASSTPMTSSGGTPGHLATENLDPNLVSFTTVSGGKLCGNVTSQSLANVLAPDALVGCGFGKCSQCYTASNTLLDIIIGGCTIFLTQIKSTQPDGSRTGSNTWQFTTSSSTKAVTGCKKNNQTAVLSDCLMNSTYSSFLKFTTDRVIAK